MIVIFLIIALVAALCAYAGVPFAGLVAGLSLLAALIVAILNANGGPPRLKF